MRLIGNEAGESRENTRNVFSKYGAMETNLSCVKHNDNIKYKVY